MTISKNILHPHYYINKLYNSDVIEFVGVNKHNEFIFRYLGDDNKDIFFSIDKQILNRYYQKKKI